MGRISLIYILSVLVFALLILYMTEKYPNYHNQFDKDRFEKIKDPALLMNYELEIG